jgi:putative transposase
MSAGKWFVSIQTEREVEQPVPKSRSAIGIDMGVTRFATMSDGSYLVPLSSFKRHELGLRRYQRRMSRKVKFSNNWKKAKTRVQRIHTRIGNARRDYLHKATTAISQNHAMVCIEDLQVRNMSKSAKGNADKPGKNVRAKSGLRLYLKGQPANASKVRVYRMRLRGKRRRGRRNEHTGAGTPRCSLWRGRKPRQARKGKARSLGEAGTRRSDLFRR